MLHVVADDETGELSSLVVLQRYGAIPEEFEEEVRALKWRIDSSVDRALVGRKTLPKPPSASRPDGEDPSRTAGLRA